MTTYNRTITLASNAVTITQDFSTDDSVVVTVNATAYSAGASASISIQSGDVAVSSSTVSIGSSFTITGISAGAYSIYLFLFDKTYGSQQGYVQGNVTQGEVLPAFPTASNQTISSTTTSVTAPISGGSVGDAYSLCRTSGLTTNAQVVADRIGDYIEVGGSFVIPNGELPAAGSSKTYYIYSYRFAAYGGAEQYYEGNSFTVTRLAPSDTTPDQFTFTDVSNVALGSLQTSNLITITGIDTSTSVSISGGTYSKNGGAYTSSAGTAVNGDTFAVRHTSSFSFSTSVNTTLNVGGVTDTFTSTTLAADTTPNQFTFTDVTNVGLSSTQTSNTITISGLNTSTSVSVSGGTYSKNGGAYTSSAGTAVNGDTFAVRHTSSASYSTAVNTTLNVGGVSDTFTSTTQAAPADTTPDQFTFTDVTNVGLSSTQTSNTITISGINASTSVSVSGGTYSKNGGTYTSSAGTAVNGDTFAVRHTSSASFSTSVDTTLNVGGVSDTFTSTTQAAPADTTPNAFDLGGPVTGVGLSVNVFSNTITVSGINTATSISVSGTGSPAYSKNGGAFTASSGTVVNGDQVQVRVTSSASSSTSVTATLNIGGVTDTFTATTAAGGGAGSQIPSGAADYGIEIRGPDGVTKVLSPTTRYGCAMGQWDTFTLTASGTAGDNYLVLADMTGLTVTNSTLLILTNVITAIFTITRESNGFRVENTADASYTLKAVPIRF